MATQADDMIRLNLPDGIRWINVKGAGLEWPPPEQIAVELDPDTGPTKFERASYSRLTDDEIVTMPNVFRGADYYPMKADV